MPPSPRLAVRIVRGTLAALLSLNAAACGPSAEPEPEETDEGNLFGFGSSQVSVIVGRTVINDATLTAAVARSGKKVAASRRDGELSGGLVSLAGGELDKTQYGIICTPRDGTCVVRWLARDREIEPITFGGELGKKIAAVLSKSFDGDSARVVCDERACALGINGLVEKNVEFVETKVDFDAVRAFAGF